MAPLERPVRPAASSELRLDPRVWSQLVQNAISNPDPEEAVRSLGEHVGVLTCAVAGAVVQLPARHCRVAWGCAASEVQELLGDNRILGAAITRQEEWRDAPLWLPLRCDAASELAATESAVLVPMMVREVVAGVLVLFFARPSQPRADVAELLCTAAGIGALVLENERLQDEARQARQLRDDFITAINHELRTPATAFVLDAFVLRSGMYGVLPDTLEKHLQQIESHLEIITRVLDGVLALGQNPGTAAGYGDVFQPRQIVLNLLRRIEPAAKRKNLPILLYAPRTLPMIQVDVNVFSRVLLHLLSNAVKYTAEGRIEVRIEQTTRAVGRQQRERILVVRVSDTGCGIPQEHIPRIFEPFAQVEEGSRTDSRNRGLGLGLSIAHRLARSIRGELTIESSVGRGTAVNLTVPYHH